jgi:hypothetical protein
MTYNNQSVKFLVELAEKYIRHKERPKQTQDEKEDRCRQDQRRYRGREGQGWFNR